MWVATVLVLIATMPGGIRKQLGVDDVQPQSRLGVLLKAKYNRSRITSRDIAELAATQSDSCGGLAKLGKGAAFRNKRFRWGKWKPDTRTSSRGLARVLAKDAVLPKPLLVEVPSWDEAANKQVQRRLAILKSLRDTPPAQQ